MAMRVGKVTEVDSSSRKVTVLYEDTGNTSLPLSVVSMSGIYSLPAVGDRVVTFHLDNGSSKGFVLGSYLIGSTQAKAVSLENLLERLKNIEDAIKRIEDAL